MIDKGVSMDPVWEDFCGNVRNGLLDLGAIEYGKSSSGCAPVLER